MAFGIIYRLIDGTNDKEYVGQTTRSLDERFKEHKKRKKNLISKTIRKHGEDMFVKAILKECNSQEKLNYWEKYFIKSRGCMVPNGYNLTEGGERAWTHIPEVRAKISLANSGENHPFFGMHYTGATC